ncbi:MAG: ATP phosphoribosyltransferase [Rhodospirillales bacterium]|nr:ATP phosphoribosyltransferase [Rhodospirillales bacterium]
MAKKLILALPKGRILDQVEPILTRCDIIPDPGFNDEYNRGLRFTTNHPNLDIIRVRAFDVATFVAFGAAQIGIVGSDVIEEFKYDELCAPLDLKIGKCRLSVAMLKDDPERTAPKSWSHINVATKYPHLTRQYYATKGIQAECIKLNGAMEIAPSLELCRRIVDLVESGKTLQANNLEEIETIMDVSTYLVVNRTASKVLQKDIQFWMNRFEAAINQSKECLN